MQMNAKTTMRLSVVALVLAAGCGGAAGEFDDGEDDVTAAAKAAKFFTIQHDDRKCPSPECGGYFVTPLKSSDPVYVQRLDLSKSGLTAAEHSLVTEAPAEELVLLGKLSSTGKTLKVTAAFRGLPGVVPAARDAFFTVRDESKVLACVRSPCDNKVATDAVSGNARRYAGQELQRALKTLVDASWLTERIQAGNAVVTAKITDRKGSDGVAESVLDVSQVFVRLPEAPSCPQVKMAACPEGQVRAFARDANRCLLPATCVVPGVCNKMLVSCDDGYTMQSWTVADNACQAHACDPTWAVADAAGE